jgi:hypothetical protein
LDQFLRWIELDAEHAPENTPPVFLVLCGVIGLGQLASEGRTDLLPYLRQCSNDSRWRVREGVALALQRMGAVDMDALLREMTLWCSGNHLEQRAAVAALCEPSLLCAEPHALAVLRLLDLVTNTLAESSQRGSMPFRVLRKGLAYCWSVAIVAAPEKGKALFSRWVRSTNRDVMWLVRQNLGKKRLHRLDEAWVESMLRQATRSP